jgi:hypothetical protein
MKWGVIGIQYRQVDCLHKPDKQAGGASFPGVFPPGERAGREATGEAAARARARRGLVSSPAELAETA